jgi:hypothetical protein
MSGRHTVSDRACEHLDRISGSDPCRVIIMDLLDEISRLSGLVESRGIALASEREQCAKIADPPKSEPSTPEARLARTVREIIAAAIRARRP